MNYTLEDVMKYVEDEDAKFIRLAFRDAFGIQKNISVMQSELKKAFEDGIPVNARQIAGFGDCKYASLFLKPDADTLSVLPWRPDSGKVLRMFCDVYTPDGAPFMSDTRLFLKAAMEESKKEGIEFRFGNETEFYLFANDEEGNPTKKPYDNAGYMDIAPVDRCENLRREIILTIERMGLTPERSHHERGPGQNEIDFHYAKPLKAADQLTTFKMAVNTIAGRYGLTADFTPMPLPGRPGNGYHINTYAADRDGNDMAKFVAAGILKFIREITIFMNPTEASYSRFGTNSAPDRIYWSDEGESELIYIETFKGRTRVELRSPDAGSNPYIVFALLIYAGLEGIRGRFDLPKMAAEPDMRLPSSRKEAAALAVSSDFVRKHIPEEIIKVYTEI